MNGLCSGFNFNKDPKVCCQVDIGEDYRKVLFYNFNKTTPIPLGGLEFHGEIKDCLGGSVFLAIGAVNSDQETGFYIPDPSTGEIWFLIKKEQTSLIPEGLYPYTFWQTTTSNGDREIFMQGEIQFFNRGF